MLSIEGQIWTWRASSKHLRRLAGDGRGRHKNANCISTLSIKRPLQREAWHALSALRLITIDHGEREPFKDYARTLRWILGEVTVSCTTGGSYGARAFLSRARDLLAVEMTAACGKLDTHGVSHHDTAKTTQRPCRAQSASFHYSNSNPFLSF
jgi:hypothetical protein